MQQVVVPQFLDVEDKIIGPVTVRQFIEMVVGGLIILLFYQLFTFPVFVVLALIIMGLTLVIAFVKINGQPFHLFLLNFIQTLKSPKLKVWKKYYSANELKEEKNKEPVIAPPQLRAPIPTSKISEIALMVDTGGIYQGENGL